MPLQWMNFSCGRCGNEPSDATRVVNAVLTQLDNIKRLKNVLILTSRLRIPLNRRIRRIGDILFIVSLLQHPMSRE